MFKRLVSLVCVCIFFLAVSSNSAIADDKQSSKSDNKQIGIYVAPKFFTGYAYAINWNREWRHLEKVESGTGAVTGGDQGAGVWGGTFAIGYDFNKRFNVPVRAEIEYGIFGHMKLQGGHWEAGNGLGPRSSERQWDRQVDLDIQTLLFNAYYDFRNSTPFTPYVGGGLGLAFITSKWRETKYYSDRQWWKQDYYEKGSSKLNTNFAWQLGLGVAYDFNDYVSVDLGYRLMGLGPVQTSSTDMLGQYHDGTWYGSGENQKFTIDNLLIHQVNLGIRVTF